MNILNDEIHKCKECKIYLEYGEPCSSRPTLTLEICKFCTTRFCCISPALPLLPCEENTILDKVEEGEYIEYQGIIPFNIKTKYCKHLDMNTMNCKVYDIRPIACRIAGEECMSPAWIRTLTERRKFAVSIK